MMKNAHGAMVLVLVFLLLAGGALAQQQSLNLTYNPMPFNVPSMVERDQGLLAAHGVVAEYSQFLAGHAMTEAMAAGELDLAPVMGGTSAIISAAGGRNIRILQAYSRAPEAFALVGRPGEFSLKQLEGASIAFPVGTEVHYLLARILEEQGLTLDDVVIVNLMVPDAVAALRSGQVDAAVIVEPVLSSMAQAGHLEVVRDGQGLIAGVTLSVVRGDLIGDPRIEAFREAHQSALHWMEEQPEAAVALAAAETNLPLPLAETLYTKYDFDPALDTEVLVDLQRSADFLYEVGLIRNPVDVANLVVAQ